MRRIETTGLIDYVEIAAERQVRLLSGRARSNKVSARCDITGHRTTTEIRHAVRISVAELRRTIEERGGQIRNVTVIYPPGIGL